MRRPTVTNALLLVIAVLLGTLVALVYQQRPVTRAELERLADQNQEDALMDAHRRIPLTRVTQVDRTVDVNVENSTIDVEVQNITLSVEIER